MKNRYSWNTGFEKPIKSFLIFGGCRMKQIRIVADSSCDLLALDGADLTIAPLTLRTETQEFRDDAALDVGVMVEALRSSKERSYSACPNIMDWETAFGSSGDILAFTITSSLSGSYGTACAAKETCEEKDPERRIHVIDTLSAGPEIALLMEKAVSVMQTGAVFDEVCGAVQEYQAHTHLLFALESLHNLAQNGRISKLAAATAGMLGIRAIGQVSTEGTLEILGKCRGARKTKAYMLDEMVKLGYAGGSVRIGHCQNESFAMELRTEILRRCPGADVKAHSLRGLCSYYAECGGIMMGFES